jgi:hypothetical protein
MWRSGAPQRRGARGTRFGCRCVYALLSAVALIFRLASRGIRTREPFKMAVYDLILTMYTNCSKFIRDALE